MHKMTVLAGSFSILLLLATFGALFVTSAAASPEIRKVPAEYPTIQAAIDAANPGDIIEVASNTYYEHVVVNKSLTLVGESSSTTIIDGNRIGTVVRSIASDVKIRGFTVQNGGDSPDSGILLGSCVRNTIYDCIVRDNAYGIRARESNSSIIVGNKIMNNSWAGIHIIDSSNNIIHYNMIVNNSWGVWVTSPSSLFNVLYHNNFIDNLNHAQDLSFNTIWDNGAEGNYWSDYKGEGGEDLDGDGIGENLLPYQNVDWCPLMEPWSPYRVFGVTIDEIPYNVTTLSNSTLASFNFSVLLKRINFNVTSGASGFCNVTIPKTLLNASTSEKWKVIIDGRLLSTEERTVKENEAHTSIYFTYTAGIHEVQITTRVSSTISIALSSTTTTLGSNVTISGNITADDSINPLRPNVTVTIQSRSIGAVTWNTIGTVETYSNSIYTYAWTPQTGGIHEVMASWEGDEETIGDKSDLLALTALYVFETVQDFYVVIETNSTVSEFNSISAFNFSQASKQISFDVTSPYGTIGYSNVTIPKELLEPEIGWKVIINGTLLGAEEIIATENATHISLYFTYSRGVNEVQISIRRSSTISMILSSDSIDLGSSATISGSVTAADNTARAYVTVTILYRLSGGNWTTLYTVETDENGNYTHLWEPETVGTYHVMASWEGDDVTFGDESDVLTLTVKEAPGIPVEIVTVAVVAIIVIATIVVYFARHRKSR